MNICKKKGALVAMCAVLILILGAGMILSVNASAKTAIPDTVTIEYSASNKFSDAEIAAAGNAILKKFVADFKKCELICLYYDEEHSDSFAEGYMSVGRGAVNGVDPSNVIVLYCNFKTGSVSKSIGMSSNQTYPGWSWVLIRDSATSPWRIDDWGY